MALSEIQAVLRGLSAVGDMPDVLDLVDRAAPHPTVCWNYAPLACRAMGGRAEDALPAAVAIFCMLAAIHLVDDMLDEDPSGNHHRIGPGRAANAALSFQAAGTHVVSEAGLSPSVEHDLQRWLADMSMQTALAQHRDLTPCQDEEDYWRLVDAKTPPLFCCALAMGARLGGASTATAEAVGTLGRALGRLIQISDDLRDALETPASADWARPRNNLALLYAMEAPHAQREAFLDRLPRISEPSALTEAQAMIFGSGAASYCIHRMVEAHTQGVRHLESLELAVPTALRGLLDAVLSPVVALLRRSGVTEPARALEAAIASFSDPSERDADRA